MGIVNDYDNVLDRLKTRLTSEDVMKRRAQSKALQLATTAALCTLTSPMHDSYVKSLGCSETVKRYELDLSDLGLPAESKIYKSHYCKTRWCQVCNRIRTAKLIAQYEPILSQLTDLQFVTLTLPHTHEDKLEDLISTISKTWRAILKHSTNNCKIGLRGIRKLEVNYSARTGFHPHYHCILEGKKQAEWLVSQWLKRVPGTNEQAQDIREAKQDSMIELFKYQTKTLGKVTDKNGNKVFGLLSLYKLDEIYTTLHRNRTLQTFGTLPKPETTQFQRLDEIYDINAQGIINLDYVSNIEDAINDCDDYEVFQFDAEAYDWLCTDTGEFLSNFEPSDNFRKLIEQIRDQTAEQVLKASQLSLDFA